MNFLIRGILSKAWAIDARFVQAHLTYIASILDGQIFATLPEDIKFSQAYIVESSTGRRANTGIANADKGSIAIVELQGPMMKHDQECGPAGTASVADWIKQADANPNIEGIVLKADTPGGTVDGTEELARVISSTKKPIIGFVDGLCASAGYWAISQCDEIIASGKTSEIGSIGTMAKWADMKPILEKAGVKFHEVFATRSTEKNHAIREALAGNYEPVVEELDILNEVFINNVKSGRASAKIKESVFAGNTFFSADAKRLGLIDRIGTLEDALKSVKIKSQTKQKMNKNNAAAFPLLMDALGWTNGFEALEEGIHVSMEDLGTIEAQLKVGATAFQQVGLLTIERDTVASSLSTANTTAQNLTIERDALQARVTALGTTAAHKGTTIKAAKSELTKEKVMTGFVPDGSELIAEKIGMDTSNWFE